MSTVDFESIQPELVSKLVISNVAETNDSVKEVVEDAGNPKADANENNSNKQKKKLAKLADSILKKSVGSSKLNTVEDKYYAIIQNYIDLQEQNKKLLLNSKEMEKTVANITKHRELIQTDYNKAVFAKDKMESLCRELQKHNKLIKDENLQRIKEEEDKRKDITSKFQLAIDDINQQVASNSEKNNLLMTENTQLTGKLKNLIEQYEVREKHIEKLMKHKDLEVELANAKLQQSELRVAEATERSKAEKSIYENHITELNKKCEFHIETEKQLKAQLSMYTEKYEEFQTTLKKSNQVFESFKTEMDKMTKKIKKLEQETSTWKTKWETSDKALQSVVKQKEEMDEKVRKAQTKANIMESLSRTLQTERNELKEKLKEYEHVTNTESVVVAKAEETEEVNTGKPVQVEAQSSATLEGSVAQNESQSSFEIVLEVGQEAAKEETKE